MRPPCWQSGVGTKVLWVRNVNDAPRLVGPRTMHARVRNATHLPPLSIADADGEIADLELQLLMAHGEITLSPPIASGIAGSAGRGIAESAGRERLHFVIGDGVADRLLRMRGSVSALNSALQR